MDIREVLTALTDAEGVAVAPPLGQPHLGGLLNDEIRTFYNVCGGITFYVGTPHEVEILPPAHVLPANHVIAYVEEVTGDRSDHWYVIARTSNGDYLVVDLASDRAGRIYDGFFETYGLVGDMPIVANSLAEFCLNLVQDRSKGDTYFWLAPGRRPLGDAYDD